MKHVWVELLSADRSLLAMLQCDADVHLREPDEILHDFGRFVGAVGVEENILKTREKKSLVE